MPRYRLKGYVCLDQGSGGPPYDKVGETVVEAGDRSGAVQLGLDHFSIRGAVKGWVKVDELCPTCGATEVRQRPTKENRYFFEWHCPSCDPGDVR